MHRYYGGNLPCVFEKQALQHSYFQTFELPHTPVVQSALAPPLAVHNSCRCCWPDCFGEGLAVATCFLRLVSVIRSFLNVTFPSMWAGKALASWSDAMEYPHLMVVSLEWSNKVMFDGLARCNLRGWIPRHLLRSQSRAAPDAYFHIHSPSMRLGVFMTFYSLRNGFAFDFVYIVYLLV